MTHEAVWLGETDVASLVSLDDAIDALESGLRALGRDEGSNIPKALGGFGDGSSVHSLGSMLPEAGYCGYKNWINTKQGAKAVFVLFDTTGGRLLAVMEANALGQLRTSAMTGLGTKWIAREGADDMAMIGSGRQALMQIAAIHAARPLSRLRIWSPTPEKRRAFTEEVRQRLSIEVTEAPTLEAATDGASIVTTVTRARAPFLSSTMLAAGTHLNAVGAILPANAEFHQDIFERVDFISVDDVPNTMQASREFIDYFEKGAGAGDWARLHPLSRVIASGERAPVDSDITLFKAMGMGISDLSIAKLVYERATSKGMGLKLPLTTAVPLRWQAA